ncbi:MAG: hypothetical protein AAGI38_01725 [Bacteroidota bacterium]
MKKSPLILLLLLCTSTIFAQIGGSVGVNRIKKLVERTTLVVLENDDPVYNNAIIKATQLHWNFTPVRYIQREELGKYMPSDDHAMLIRTRRKVEYPLRYKVLRQEHNDVALLLCDEDSLKDMPGFFEIASIELEGLEAWTYKLSGLVGAMNSYVTFMHENKADKDVYDKHLKQFTTKRAKELTALNLLVEPALLPDSLKSASSIKLYYPTAASIADQETIQIACDTQDSASAFIHMENKGNYYQVIRCSDGAILYQDDLEDQGILQPIDFQRLAAKVEGNNLKYLKLKVTSR